MFNPNHLYLERIGGKTNDCKYIHFSKPITKIGRSSLMDYFFDSVKANTVSREHSELKFKNGKMFITNLSKTNPTFINNDKVIRQTEVEEGDLVGFGSKPYCVYPHFSDDQIFIYKCKRQQIEVVEIVDDDDVLVVETPNFPQVLPAELEARSKIDPQPTKVVASIISEEVDSSIEEIVTFSHFDTIESLKDKPVSDAEEYSSQDEDCLKYSLRSLHIVLTKLPPEELEKWKPKCNDLTEVDQVLSKTSNEKARSKLYKKYNPKKLVNIVDPDDSDSADALENIPITPSKYRIESEVLLSADKVTKRSVSLNENESDYIKSKVVKRRASVTEKDDNLVKKSKSEELKPSTSNSSKKIEFPELSPSTKSVPTRTILIKPRRVSLYETKNDTDNDFRKLAISNSQIKKRRISMYASSNPIKNIISPKTKHVKKRRTSCFMEFDMFTMASKLRNEKYGAAKAAAANGTDKGKEVQQKEKLTASEVTKTPTIPVETKKPDQEKEADKNLCKNTREASLSSSNNHTDIKKAAVAKVKLTEKNRGHYLTEEIPQLSKNVSPLKKSSSLSDQAPSTSKVALSISAFREKYVKPAEETAKKVVNNNNQSKESPPSTDDPLAGIDAQISLEMEKNDIFVEPIQIEHETEQDSISPIEDTELETDDEGDKEPLDYELKTESPSNNENIQKNNCSESPMKNDPRGKTKWISQKFQFEDTFELQPFPEIPLIATTIHVYQENLPIPTKSILKSLSDFTSATKQPKKRVSFDFNRTNVKVTSRESSPINIPNLVATVQPMKTTRHPNIYESTVCSKILEWNPEWMKIGNELPPGWKFDQIPNTFNSLDDYKSTIQKIMDIDLLRKIANKFRSPFMKDKLWDFLTVKERKDEPNNHLKLVLSHESEEMRQGCLLLLKVRDNSCSQKPKDIYFFGYVTVVNARGEMKVDAYSRELPKEMVVIKSKAITFIRNELKQFSIINAIQETPLLKLFLNPHLNKFDRKNGISSIKLDTESLNTDQRVMLKMLTSECIKDSEKIFFINGHGGVGKTFLMISTVLNIKLYLKDQRRQYLICASTLTGIDEISGMLTNRPCYDSFKIVRVGFYDKKKVFRKKIMINDQVQYRISKGAKGTYQEIYKEIIESADIILTTCPGCYDLNDYDLSIDICFIDEANHCTDSELLFPMKLNVKKLVLVGDEYQLAPTQSPSYKEAQINVSYFNRMIEYYKLNKLIHAPVFTLTMQQRMNRDLFNICNKFVYNNNLRYSINSPYSTSNFPFKPFMVFVINMSSDFTSTKDSMTIFVMKLCDILPKSVSIGIINSFQSQKENYRISFDKDDRDSRVEFTSIENAQSIEKDVVILTIRRKESHYLDNFNRMNVALTRARKALYICTSRDLNSNEAGLVLRLRNDAESNGYYHEVQNENTQKLSRILRNN